MIDREPTCDRRRAARLCRRRACRPTAAPPSSNGSASMPKMPRASPPGVRRPTRSARATARSRTSRCRRVSISTALARARAQVVAASRRLRRVARVRCSAAAAGWFGRGAWEGAGPARVVTTEAFEAHRLYIAEVRHPIEVKAGESHLNPWLSRRVGYRDADAQSRYVRAEAARRSAAAGQCRPRRRALYV